MSLEKHRKRIDEIDESLTHLFLERMGVSADIAAFKKKNSLPIRDPGREREKIASIMEKASEDMQPYLRSLYLTLFEVGRAHQHRLCGTSSDLFERVERAIQETPKRLPDAPLVACQGVEGAYSQIACEKMFNAPNIMYFSNFESVFSAIDQGLCRYGVLPLENSTAGSVNAIYDLMMKYDFSIVRSARIKVDHCLLVNSGASMNDIKEIFSHEQALAQCAGFLKSLGNIKITPCENTAGAAKMLFESGRKDAAALSSSLCAELYGLQCLHSSVQDHGGNFTRFICISKKLEIYPGADKTSVMVILSHKPGSLYHALSGLFALGVNINKLESRPLPESDFEFMFYFDLSTSVYSESFKQMLVGLEESSKMLRYLGSYMEVV
ncbi:MAG: bifunctional chorismate mutase/prephenate dehydratase [Synergistaceae bacterium]|nr:bifunctional chorismate mutase/prephenate dehydratase [Synergistaceae bacterium]